MSIFEHENLMTTQEVAKLLGVGPSSVKRWADDGRLPTIKTPGGHRRFRKNDVLSLRDDLSPELEPRSNKPAKPALVLEQLPRMSPAEIDQLDTGVVKVDDAGFVRLYNQAETKFSGIPAEQAVGQHFFGELAPCTKNRIIFGRFKEGVRSNRLDFSLFYTFTYRMRPTNVELHLYRDPATQTNWILIRPV